MKKIEHLDITNCPLPPFDPRHKSMLNVGMSNSFHLKADNQSASYPEVIVEDKAEFNEHNN